jgi:eukaryotic-like serine/threonine-protein kinase
MPVLPDPAAGAISFQVLAEISAGATARIDLCRATDARRPDLQGQLLAVKRLHPHVAEDPGFQNQFQDEVWMTSSLTHPNVVEVKGWGTDGVGSYLAVELVQGVSLARLMKTVFDTGEVFTERMVVYVASRLCRGLAAAHALRAPNGELLNLVHRDLTPGNVLVGFNGDVKIADFGLAKAKQRLTKTLTGMSKGEPTYMAPEQARADEIDARADLFSLGVMLFELFAGRRPWLAKSDFEMVQVTSRDPPADLRELRPKIDRELIAVVNKCLEKDPATRFQSAGEIADRLENWLSVHGYMEGNEEALGRFVRRNAMRQMRWFERAISGELAPKPKIGRQLPPRAPAQAELPRPRIPGAPVPRQKLRTPTLDDEDSDETDITEAEWKIARQAQQGQAPRIVAKDEAEGEGEEMPTLVQSGSGALDALRADARARKPGARGQSEPALTGGEDTDQRITAVKRTNDGAPMPVIHDESSSSEELPTEPVRARHPSPVRRIPPAPQRPGPRNEQRPGTIPPSPNVPQFSGAGSLPLPRLPLPTEAEARQRPTSLPEPLPPPLPSSGHGSYAPPPLPPTFSPSPSYAPPSGFGPPPSNAPPPLSSPSNAPSPIYAPPKTEPPPPMPMRGRGGASDDVQVLDRKEMQGHQGHAITEESLIAEADRLAIEAVRRSEEARSAALRAERRAAMAKMAAEAALIAADAVRLLSSSGLAAAAQRLEQARQVERTIPRSAQGDAATSTAVLHDSASASHASSPSVAPSANRPSFSPPVYEGAASSSSQRPPSFPQLPPSPTAPILLPAPSSYTNANAGPSPSSSLQTDPGSRSPGLDDAAFRARLKPGLLGMPPLAIAGLGIVAFCIVFLLIWLFFG